MNKRERCWSGVSEHRCGSNRLATEQRSKAHVHLMLTDTVRSGGFHLLVLERSASAQNVDEPQSVPAVRL
jgi:hypothetical protein